MAQNKATAKTVVLGLSTPQLQAIATAAVDAYLAILESGRGKLHPHIDALGDAIRTNIGHIGG